MKNNFFPERPQIEPTIYVYELTGVDSHKGFVKVGYTERDVKERIKEQLHTSAVDFKVLYQECVQMEQYLKIQTFIKF